MTIEILLVDDRCLTTEGIKAILKHEPEIKVVGIARDGRSAIAKAKILQPDIVLMDIEMPKMDGITATKYICQHLPNTRVIVLTSHQNYSYISQALQAGASSYISKDSLLEDLKRAIYSLERGYSYIDAKLLTQAIDKIQKTNAVKYQEKITYLKKHRKSIYTPSIDIARRSLSLNYPAKHKADRKAHRNLSKASLYKIFESETHQGLIASPTSDELRDYNLQAIQRRRYYKKITWLAIAILSLLLSLVVF